MRERTSGSTVLVCVQLTGGLEIPLSVTLSTQNNTALGKGVRRRYVRVCVFVLFEDGPQTEVQLYQSCYCEANKDLFLLECHQAA